MAERVGFGHSPRIENMQVIENTILAFRAFLHSHGSVVQKLVQKIS
jgi:hypothetical protein